MQHNNDNQNFYPIITKENNYKKQSNDYQDYSVHTKNTKNRPISAAINRLERNKFSARPNYPNK
jgi:hypothetical protein